MERSAKGATDKKRLRNTDLDPDPDPTYKRIFDPITILILQKDFRSDHDTQKSYSLTYRIDFKTEL